MAATTMPPSSPKKLSKRKVPNGLKSCWRLWRNCLGRNGLYPLVVAPYITAAWLLDMYGTLGCNLIHVDVGMETRNAAWNETSIEIGLFHYTSSNVQAEDLEGVDTAADTLSVMNTLHPECRRYDSIFEEYFIEGDQSWKVSQYMAMISACAGCFATVVIWMMIISPLPAKFFWNGFLLPSTMIMLLSGASKFFIFDNQICHALLWLPKEGEPIPQKAEECHASKDLTVTMCASILSLASIFLVYARTPKRRPLDETFGRKYMDLTDKKNNEIMAVVPVGTVDTMEDIPDDAESQKEVKVPNMNDYLEFHASPESIRSKASQRSSKNIFSGSWEARADEDASSFAGHQVKNEMMISLSASKKAPDPDTHVLDFYENDEDVDDDKSVENVTMKFVGNVIW